MPSPFPGMDPWLERPAIFPDLHTAFLSNLRAALNAVLPPPFYAGVSTRVWMEESERRVEPDVDVLKPLNGTPGGRADSGGGIATLPESVTGLLEIAVSERDEEMTETFVEVFAAPGEEQLVASIELLSPSNKTPGSGGRDLYRAKQQELRQADVHMIEIDLLRRGTHATLVPLESLRLRAGRYDYHICLHRARSASYFVIPLQMADRLPRIPVWLTEDVVSVTIDLQAVLNRCYDEAQYARRVRYHQVPEPPLTEAQAQWAEQILREKSILPST